MPRAIVIVVLLGLAAVVCLELTSNSPADRRLADLAQNHAQQQAVQNERLSELQRQWRAERSDLYKQRDELESDRRQLAVERLREPIVAESIRHVGTLALALLPLAVCLLLIRRSQQPDDGDAISETLVADLVSARPTLFVSGLPSPTAIGHLTAPDNPSPREEPSSP